MVGARLPPDLDRAPSLGAPSQQHLRWPPQGFPCVGASGGPTRGHIPSSTRRLREGLASVSALVLGLELDGMTDGLRSSLLWQGLIPDLLGYQAHSLRIGGFVQGVIQFDFRSQVQISVMKPSLAREALATSLMPIRDGALARGTATFVGRTLLPPLLIKRDGCRF